MKKFFLLIAIVVFVFQARTSPNAVPVLTAANWAPGRIPSEWQVKVNHGKPDISVCRDAPEPCIRMKSVGASFALERGVDVNPHATPYLAWTWKVTELPPAGDFRKTATDDQAAQVLVAFADRKVLTYIWDSNAPKGTTQSASSIPLVHIYAVVAESGAAQKNRWVQETRDVAADYERAFGKPAPHVKGLRLQINSQHTGSVAESYFGEIAFRSTAN